MIVSENTRENEEDLGKAGIEALVDGCRSELEAWKKEICYDEEHLKGDVHESGAVVFEGNSELFEIYVDKLDDIIDDDIWDDITEGGNICEEETPEEIAPSQPGMISLKDCDTSRRGERKSLAKFIPCTAGCGKMFYRQCDLLDHLRTRHGAPKLVCPWSSCEARYGSSWGLKLHLKGIHKSKKNHQSKTDFKKETLISRPKKTAQLLTLKASETTTSNAEENMKTASSSLGHKPDQLWGTNFFSTAEPVSPSEKEHDKVGYISKCDFSKLEETSATTIVRDTPPAVVKEETADVVKIQNSLVLKVD